MPDRGPRMPVDPDDAAILDVVAAETGAVEELLVRLVEAPTLLGNEEPGQALMAEAFAELGLEPVDVPMDAEPLRAHPAAAPFSWDVSGKRNVVATWGEAREARWQRAAELRQRWSEKHEQLKDLVRTLRQQSSISDEMASRSSLRSSPSTRRDTPPPRGLFGISTR